MASSPEILLNDDEFAIHDDLLKLGVNQCNMEYLKTNIKFCTKNKISYTLIVVPSITDDRKTLKRSKRVSSHNMFILFNSFYTKIRKPEWPTGHSMWNTVKSQKELADFKRVFNHTQKLGKNILKQLVTSSSSSTENGKRRRRLTIEAPESCDELDGLYADLYNVLIETYKNGVAPASSSIYDGVITREFVTKNMELFKNIALKLPPSTYVPLPVSKKRRAPVSVPKKLKQRRDTKPPPAAYVNDNTQDTNMSE